MKKILLSAAVSLFSLSSFAQGIDVSTANHFEIGLPTYGKTIGDDIRPTVAMCGQLLVLHFGDGTTPIYINVTTGQKLGEITLGNVKADGSVTSDDKGNMVIAEACGSGEVLKIYRVNSVTEAPTLLAAYSNTTSLPLGNRIHVSGDLDGNAQIIATVDGTPEAGSNQFVRWMVVGGSVSAPELVTVTLNSDEYWWGGTNNARVFAKSANIADGYFVGHYDNGDNFYHINGETNAIDATIGDGSGGSAWAYNNNCGDSRTFNGVNYTAFCSLSMFNYWGVVSYVYLHDTSDITKLSATLNAESSLVAKIGYTNFATGENQYSANNRVSDVLIVTTENTMSVLHVNNHDLVLAGTTYSAKVDAAIEDVEMDENAPIEYFNLQGVSVENPTNGLYIRRQGNKVSKVYVK